MAPERARGEEPTPASDLWSLGATLFAAVEGQPPFHRDGQLPTLAAVVTQEAPAAEHAGAMRPVLAALLSREPRDRPSAAQARGLLLAAAESVPIALDPASQPAATGTATAEPAVLNAPAVATCAVAAGHRREELAVVRLPTRLPTRLPVRPSPAPSPSAAPRQPLCRP